MLVPDLQTFPLGTYLCKIWTETV